MNEKEMTALGMVIIFVIGTIIYTARYLYPLFAFLTLLSFIALIITLLIDLFKKDKYFDFMDWKSLIPGALFIFFGFFTWASYSIGYGFGNTPIGQTSLMVHDSINDANQKLTDAVDQSINQLVEENCKVLDQQSCSLLREAVKSGKTLQEISDMADNLKKIANIANK